jgi:hypothetical protein
VPSTRNSAAVSPSGAELASPKKLLHSSHPLTSKSTISDFLRAADPVESSALSTDHALELSSIPPSSNARQPSATHVPVRSRIDDFLRPDSSREDLDEMAAAISALRANVDNQQFHFCIARGQSRVFVWTNDI